MTVLSWWMQEGFSYCHSNLIFWVRDLPTRQYHYGGRETSTTHTGYRQSLLLYWYQVLSCRRAEKDLSHTQKPTGNVRGSFKIT